MFPSFKIIFMYISLNDYYRRLASREQLIGLKVYDPVNMEELYIKDAEGGLWCGKNKNDEFGRYYTMARLEINENDIN